MTNAVNNNLKSMLTNKLKDGNPLGGIKLPPIAEKSEESALNPIMNTQNPNSLDDSQTPSVNPGKKIDSVFFNTQEGFNSD